jgi:hypothetical protein
MSLIVEDGTVVANANSYTSLAYASNYHGSVGNFAWAAIATAASSPPPGTMTQDALLQKATQYMVGVYRLRWSGLRVQPDAIPNPALGGVQGSWLPGQSLDWPRIGVILKDTASFFVDQRLAYTVPSNIVPDVVQQACCELALRAATQNLWPDLDQRTLVEKVGAIQVNYDRFSPQFRRFRQIDLMLNPYLDGTNGLTTKINRV